MKNLLYFLASIILLTSCSEEYTPTLSEIQSNIIDQALGKDSFSYEYSENRTANFKCEVIGEDTLLFVFANKEGLLIDALVKENGEIVIVSDTIINQSKEEDHKKRIESLLRAFNEDLPKKEPQ
jgi:hypothetical protein